MNLLYIQSTHVLRRLVDRKRFSHECGALADAERLWTRSCQTPTSRWNLAPVNFRVHEIHWISGRSSFRVVDWPPSNIRSSHSLGCKSINPWAAPNNKKATKHLGLHLKVQTSLINFKSKYTWSFPIQPKWLIKMMENLETSFINPVQSLHLNAYVI